MQDGTTTIAAEVPDISDAVFDKRKETLKFQLLTPEVTEEEIKNKELLLKGSVFLKYGSWGEPGLRLISVTPDYQLLEWRHEGEERSSGYLTVKSLMGIKFGRTTSNFKRRPAKRAEQEKLSFTVVGEKRNLDLEASSQEQMDQFLEGLVSVLKLMKKKNAANGRK